MQQLSLCNSVEKQCHIDIFKNYNPILCPDVTNLVRSHIKTCLLNQTGQSEFYILVSN